MSDSTEQINQLRNSFLQQLSTKGQDAVHPKDLERVKTDDKWLHRFLLHNEGNQEAALHMMWESLTWRKEVRANEIKEIAKKDILSSGGFFPHGHDIDGCTLFIFKCKKYIKNAQDNDELRRCVIYWFEYLERRDNGRPITLFFDMEGCGLANMDMDFTKYLIGLFKQYYPYFLNYILIYEMPWILNAAFKIIKSWLPEKAVQKIKFVTKKDIKEYVPLEVALTCWGGKDDYVFTFVPEEDEEVEEIIRTPLSSPSPSLSASTTMNSVNSANSSNRKVHFAERSMSDLTDHTNEKDHDGGVLSVQPSGVLTFVKEGDELVATLDLQNTDSTALVSFKLKTTSPDKFKVRPSVGVLQPGAKTKIKVTLLSGYKLGGLSPDKFLLMSTIINANEQDDLNLLWKDTTGRKVYQHRLKCTQLNEIIKKANSLLLNSSNSNGSGDFDNPNQISTILNKLLDNQNDTNRILQRSQYCQILIVIIMLILGIMLAILLKMNLDNNTNNLNDKQEFCMNSNAP